MTVESTFSRSKAGTKAEPFWPGRTALWVLALCFTLALVGRGIGEAFTVFLLPNSETFGWARAYVD
jgi:hypothetical protein